jgi:hypothetical protein
MTTVVAIGQFGPNNFTVLSVKGTVVDAKYLMDSVGANYIIDPNTGKPYIVPRDYDPGATAAYFTNKLNLAVFDTGAEPWSSETSAFDACAHQNSKALRIARNRPAKARRHLSGSGWRGVQNSTASRSRAVVKSWANGGIGNGW